MSDLPPLMSDSLEVLRDYLQSPISADQSERHGAAWLALNQLQFCCHQLQEQVDDGLQAAKEREELRAECERLRRDANRAYFAGATHAAPEREELKRRLEEREKTILDLENTCRELREERDYFEGVVRAKAERAKEEAKELDYIQAERYRLAGQVEDLFKERDAAVQKAAKYVQALGLFSTLALAVNLLLLVALLSMLQATLTLPGIAAIALTLGMAIDANVLIHERIREELRNGVSPQVAIAEGYERAWATILDSNVTTLIAGLALLVFGSGAIRGFAIVHCLGIMTSIFSAVVVSRGIVNLWYGRQKKLAKLSIGQVWKPTA